MAIRYSYPNPDHSNNISYTSFDWIDNDTLILAANGSLFEGNVLDGDVKGLHEPANEDVVQDLDVDAEGKKVVLSIGDGEIL